MLKSFFLALIIGFQTIAGMTTGGTAVNTAEVAQMTAPVEESKVAVVETTENLPNVVAKRPVAETVLAEQNDKVATTKVDFLAKLKDMGITVHPGKEFTADSVDNPVAEQHCASLVYKTLQVVPREVAAKVKDLTLFFNNSGRRGLGGGSTIILRCQNVTDEELVGVLTHELGHVMDTGVLTGNYWSGVSAYKDGENPVYLDDSSLSFYNISFINEKVLKAGVSNLDFVSGYAKSDPFEDFAESFNYYLLHGDDFRQMAVGNKAITEKYNFMKEKVFDGKEFNFSSKEDERLLTSRHYDSTLIDYNLDEFLAI